MSKYTTNEQMNDRYNVRCMFEKKDKVEKGYQGMLYGGGVAGEVEFKQGCQEGQQRAVSPEKSSKSRPKAV